MRESTYTIVFAAVLAVAGAMLPSCNLFAQDSPPPNGQLKNPPVKQEAVQNRPRPVVSLDLRIRQAQLYLRKGQTDQALEILEELRTTHPHDSRVIRGYGDILESLNRFDEAAALYEGEVRAGNNPALYLLDLASCYQRMGRAQSVLNTVFRYLDLYPARTRWAQDMVEGLVRRNEMGPEELAYLEGEARSRRNPAILRLAANAYVYAENHTRAIELLREADIEGKAGGRTLFPLVEVLQNRNKPDLALAVIDDVLAMKPVAGVEEEVRLAQARLLVDLMRLEEAVEAYKAMAERFPKGQMSHRALMEAAQILRDRLGDPGRAREVYQSLVTNLESIPLTPATERLLDESRLGLGECAMWEGAWADAESTFTAILESSSAKESREEAAFMIGERRLFSGDFPGAEEAYYVVPDSFPGGLWVNDALQRILFLQGNALVYPEELSGVVRVIYERRRSRPEVALAEASRMLAGGLSEELVDDLLYEKILCLIDLEGWDEAVTAVKSWPDTLSQSPLGPRALAAVAKGLTGQEDRFDEGVELYEELLFRFPQSLESRRVRPQLPELRSRAS
ncbi:MAG: tetratricopeptide repeat protein [Candidatus Eisenbacteria bacterium]|uniref:Tetratricopeptide repeat protein n=1 Tax=Eiseniibacteriota bacterium TaxID=2212470 RepID=A0A948W1Z1_UNCEI|nr:tetratricopeptide repeat protein [Candidatus Eisenbacteria bacterium]MBU1948621.1 tetratricopeptide repeat protein [Candidatus Eisenbacteria bacterium]MBU2689377.1 tetratricopeptide repeat protein [Candidatus Eisenbacteria bacterium]